jgi:hypothetical protein
VSAEVIDLRTLSPLDARHDVVDSARKTGRVVVAVEGHRTASVASEIAAVVQEQALYSLLAPVERVTGFDTVVPLKRTEHHYIPTPDRGSSPPPAGRWRADGVRVPPPRHRRGPRRGDGRVLAGAGRRQVGLDEPLVEVETDKAVVDIPSPRRRRASPRCRRGGHDRRSSRCSS